jgi:hypothetical protein
MGCSMRHVRTNCESSEPPYKTMHDGIEMAYYQEEWVDEVNTYFIYDSVL